MFTNSKIDCRYNKIAYKKKSVNARRSTSFNKKSDIQVKLSAIIKK